MPKWGYGAGFGGAPFSVRPPQYGIPLWAKRQLLEQLAPNGGQRWVGLFTAMPDFEGEGGDESTIGRVLHTAWRNRGLLNVARRINTGAIEFPELAEPIGIVGFGVWDAQTDGTLQAFGLLRTNAGLPKVYYLNPGEVPRFPDAALKFGIQ